MTTLLKNATVYTPTGFEKKDVFVSNGKVFSPPSVLQILNLLMRFWIAPIR